MQKRTRGLAQQVKQALLDLPAATLLDTVDHWLRELDSLVEDGSASDGIYQRLGYRAWSGTTRQSYASLEELYAAESEEADAYWEPPTAENLHDTLRRMPPAGVYHTVVALAADALSQKAFSLQWGKPPVSNRGYGFIQSLARYLELRRGAPDIPTAQFEALHEADLAAITAPAEEIEGGVESEEAALAALLGGEHTFHFRVAFSAGVPVPGRRGQLLQVLRQHQCLLPECQPEDGVLGSLTYDPRNRRDLDELVKLRRLLARWQRRGLITWTFRKEKPPRQKRNSHRRRRRSGRNAAGRRSPVAPAASARSKKRAMG
jgi:hypothetical protein